MFHPFFFSSFFIVQLCLLTACSWSPVQPWQKQDLARTEMQFNANPVHSRFEEHFYFSKEGSSGGKDFAGGGCGCN